MKCGKLVVTVALLWVGALGWVGPTSGPSTVQVASAAPGSDSALDGALAKALASAGFTGGIELTLGNADRLGRSLDLQMADLGRLLFFDNVLGLHEDNSCAGCHAPGFSFGDSQSIAIGVDNSGFVGPLRTGPRNMRKSPTVTNSAFYPKLMLNGRFEAKSGNPFDNTFGFKFPPPEGDAVLFGPGDSSVPTLLAAQGHIPQTELVEMAGFTGAKSNKTVDPKFDQFDDGHGTRLPNDKDRNGFLNEEIRDVVLKKLNAIGDYVARFADEFDDGQTAGFKITFPMVGQALAEFQISLTRAQAPIDLFAQGTRSAMDDQQKRGALLFFGKAKCVQCHAVAGRSNEMFSDFQNYVLGVPQIAPFDFGVGFGNVPFDGPDSNEDFGAEQITGNPADRYKFRTSPLRNVALQPAFFHNGAFTRLDDAIRHHLNVENSARSYDPVAAGVATDLTYRLGPIDPVLERLDSLVRKPIRLAPGEFADLVAFVSEGLLDPDATPPSLCNMVPLLVPSGLPVLVFEACL
jgi:cytochrome c peroxidase